MNKIQVGYGSDGRRDSTRKGLYGKRRSGKVSYDGGFNGEPTTGFNGISEDRFISLFGSKNMPKWKQELLKKGELI